MKIAQVSATFPPYMAGTGNVCYHYAIELAKLGHDVTVFTSRFPDEDYKYPDLIEVKRFKPLFRIGNAPFMPQLLSIKDYDIIHLHCPFFFGEEMIYLLRKLKGEKYVITYHNDVLQGGLMGTFLNVYTNTIMKSVIKNAEKIGVTSMDYVKHSNIKGFIEKRAVDVVEIPNGVDTNQFNPNTNCEEIKTRHGIGNKKIILFVGALDKAHYFKGLEFLLKSFAKINDNRNRLVIVGDGDLKNVYIDVSKKLNVKDKVIFVGKATDADLPKYYAASDVVVLPSITMGEAFGLVLVEAMATGKPVIASNLPGVRTVVNNGKDGFLVEPKNVGELTSKIQYLLENEEVRMKFGSEGRRKVEENYLWVNIVKMVEGIYEDCIRNF